MDYAPEPPKMKNEDYMTDESHPQCTQKVKENATHILEKEKQEWLDEIGAKEFSEPIKYVYTFPGYNGAFNLSERYLRETSLEKLKAQYATNALHAERVTELRKSQGIFQSFDSEEFEAIYNEVYKKESPVDGSCKHEIVSGLFPRHLMEKSGFLRYAGIKGKTRIVIEYDNDTGQGWRRIVTEDPSTLPIRINQKDNQQFHPKNPTHNSLK